MARQQRKVVNGKVFYVVDNVEDQVKEIWSSDDCILSITRYGPDCDKKVDEELKILSLIDSSESE